MPDEDEAEAAAPADDDADEDAAAEDPATAILSRLFCEVDVMAVELLLSG